jgi:hypothetical protein
MLQRAQHMQNSFGGHGVFVPFVVCASGAPGARLGKNAMEAAQETFKVGGSCASDAALESPKSVQQIGSANFEVGSANFGGKRPWASLVRNDETA